MMAFFIIAITMGLLGSFHCLGMCGPIALALPVGKARGMRRFFLISLYNGGRILTYAVLGVIAGLLGTGIVLAGYQQALSLVAGILLLLAVIIPFGYGPLKKANRSVYSFFNGLKATLATLFKRHGYSSLFFIGLLNGVLPCGLVYMALAGAIGTGSVVKAIIFMVIFGAGTVPVMMLLPYAGGFISLDARNKMRNAVPVAVTIMAVVLILRGLNLGIPFISPKIGSGKAEVTCCHQGAGDNLKQETTCTGQSFQPNR